MLGNILPVLTFCGKGRRIDIFRFSFKTYPRADQQIEELSQLTRVEFDTLKTLGLVEQSVGGDAFGLIQLSCPQFNLFWLLKLNFRNELKEYVCLLEGFAGDGQRDADGERAYAKELFSASFQVVTILMDEFLELINGIIFYWLHSFHSKLNGSRLFVLDIELVSA